MLAGQNVQSIVQKISPLCSCRTRILSMRKAGGVERPLSQSRGGTSVGLTSLCTTALRQDCNWRMRREYAVPKTLSRDLYSFWNQRDRK
ncbi:hypothetical protein CLOSTMETH_03751 [[Clostridium] methylpentosum DSM 5476]|uniref:Uncharacterized protein n=1 Tax=[Clostridium] methylpentosum DSM 5476 TaxID=537013 RepID=C0EIQ6_9FIRM|nr:hypothetical protein CLOSTMETH_03751 [[Clostridium] methylpentosum DSM 5476]